MSTSQNLVKKSMIVLVVFAELVLPIYPVLAETASSMSSTGALMETSTVIVDDAFSTYIATPGVFQSTPSLFGLVPEERSIPEEQMEESMNKAVQPQIDGAKFFVQDARTDVAHSDGNHIMRIYTHPRPIALDPSYIRDMEQLSQVLQEKQPAADLTDIIDDIRPMLHTPGKDTFTLHVEKPRYTKVSRPFHFFYEAAEASIITNEHAGYSFHAPFQTMVEKLNESSRAEHAYTVAKRLIKEKLVDRIVKNKKDVRETTLEEHTLGRELQAVETPLISAGSLYRNDIKISDPIGVSRLEKTNASGDAITMISEMYPGVDVEFVDSVWSRSKTIVLTSKPEIITNSDELIFFENYTLPIGAKLFDGAGNEVMDKQIFKNTNLYIGIPLSDGTEARLIISPAWAFDSRDMSADYRDRHMISLGEIVEYGADHRSFRLGIKITGEYLLRSDVVYPIIIDPSYVACKEGPLVSGTYPVNCANYFDYYARYEGQGNSATSDTWTNGVTQPDGVTAGLFAGFYKDPANAWSGRFPVLKFDYDFSTVGGSISSVTLHVFQLGNHPTYCAPSTNMPTKAYRITSAGLTPTNFLNYSGLRNAFSTTDASPTVTLSPQTGVWKQFDLTSMYTGSWKNSYSNNKGIILHPARLWQSGTTPPFTSTENCIVQLEQRESVNATYTNTAPYLQIVSPDSLVNYVASNVTLQTAAAQTGGNVNFTIRATNSGAVGPAVTGGWPVWATSFLSADTNIGSGDYTSSQGIDQTTYPLSPGSTYTVGLNQTVSSLVPTGNYHVIFKIDDNQDPESDYLDNVAVSASTVSITQNTFPDLDIDSISAPSSASAGAGIAISAVAKNIGAAAATNHSAKSFLSSNIGCTSEFANTSAFTTVSTINAGNTVGINPPNLTIPSNLSAGTYYVCFTEDIYNTISESNEVNNSSSFAIMVTASSGVDLQYRNVFFGLGSSPVAGSPFRIRADIFAFGGIPMSNFYVDYYISQNNVDCGGAQMPGTFTRQLVNALPLNTTTTLPTVSISIPETAVYYQTFCVVLDATDTIVETNNSNNVQQAGISPIEDRFEPNDSYSQATPISGSFWNDQSVYVNTDNDDWFRVTINNRTYYFRVSGIQDSPYELVYGLNGTTVSVETKKVGSFNGDTQLSLYESDGATRLAFDDNGGLNNFSKILYSLSPYSGGGGSSGGGSASQVTALVFAGQSNPTSLQSRIENNYPQGRYSIPTDKTAVADPVNARTGAFEFTQRDITMPGRGEELNFTRVYSSKNVERISRFGRGWDFSYDMFVYYDASTTAANVYQGQFKASRFISADSGNTFQPMLGDTDTLTTVNNDYILKKIDGTQYFFTPTSTTDGFRILSKIVDTAGNQTTPMYILRQGVPLMSGITDASGRSYFFTYGNEHGDTWDKIVKIEDANTSLSTYRTLEYGYDVNLNLVAVTTTIRSSGGSKQTLETFTPDTVNEMVEYKDARGTILYSTYDQEGRTTKQEEYNPDRDISGTKRILYDLTYSGHDVTVPNSSYCTTVKNYLSQTQNIYDREQYCWNSNDLRIYDAAGNVRQESIQYYPTGMVQQITDGNGHVTRYEYDSNRRKTKEILPDTSRGLHTEHIFTYGTAFDTPTRYCERSWSLGNPTPRERCQANGVDSVTGFVTSTVDFLGNAEFFTFDAYGNVLTHNDKRGNRTEYSYDVRNNYVTSITITAILPDQQIQRIVHTYIYDDFGRKISDCAPGVVCTYFTYDSSGRVQRKTIGNGSPAIFYDYGYDDEGHLTSVTDSDGAQTRYTYEKNIYANLIETRIVGRNGFSDIVTGKEYYDEGKLKADVDAMGRRTVYTYDGTGKVLSKTSPGGAVVTYTYDTNNNLTEERTAGADVATQRTVYVYDERNQLIETRRYVDTIRFLSEETQYDGFGIPFQTIDGRGNSTYVTYDRNNNLTQVYDAEGNSTEYRYDANGNKICEVFPNANNDFSLQNIQGCSNFYTYDEANRLIKILNAENKETVYFYDEAGHVTKIIDRHEVQGSDGSHMTLQDYDVFGNVFHTINPDGGTKTYSYDYKNRLRSMRNELGKIFTYTYDDADRLLSSVDPEGNSTRYEYFADGQKKKIIFPDNTFIEYRLDSSGNVERMIDQNNRITTFTYDTLGRKKTTIDRKTRVVGYGYDTLNRLTSETNADNTVTTYAFDENTNKISVTIAPAVGSPKILYVALYDRTNRTIDETKEGVRLLYTYDHNGNRRTESSPTGGGSQTVSYEYDALNRLHKKIFSVTSTQIFGYDSHGNLVTAVTPDTAVTSTYDVMNRSIREQRTLTGLNQTYTVGKTYDLAGNRQTLTDAGGRTMTYNYTDRGLLDTVVYNGTILADYSFDALGRPKTLRYQNNIRQIWDYELGGATASTTIVNGVGSILWQQAYIYDEEGNRIDLNQSLVQREEDGAGLSLVTTSIAYTYDVLDQLAAVNYGTQSNGRPITVSYQYDKFGNRISESTPLGETIYQYANQHDNRLTLYNKGQGRLLVANTYDSRGNLLSETTDRLGRQIQAINYSWSNDNRLNSIDYGNGNNLAFAYDESGNRTKKCVDGDCKYYVNNGLTVLNEVGGDGTITTSMVTGVGAVAEIDATGNVTFLNADPLGSTILETNSTGIVLSQYEYQPFGDLASLQSTQSDSSETNYLFTNQELDTESELYYVNARYYNPKTGRFISLDSAYGHTDDVLGLNGYVYVRNNPLKYTDPSGEIEEFFNSDYFQASLAYVEGLNNAAWGALEGLSNIFWHPVQSLKSIGQSFTDLFGGGYTGVQDIYNLLRVHGWAGFRSDVQQELRQMGDNFAALTPSQQGYFIGHLTEKAMEIGVMAKSTGKGIAADESVITMESTAGSSGQLRFTQLTASPVFDAKGAFAGKTIGDVADGLRNGSIRISDVEINFVKRGGYRLIENTRSSLALRRAGIPPEQWNLINKTGDINIEMRITDHLNHNGLTNSGSDVIRITGSGGKASSLK